jgi:hypothetical protein
MSDQELKPCPFCGGRASVINAMWEYWVICRNCRCTTEGPPAKGTAIYSWNTRADSEEIATLKKDLEAKRWESLRWQQQYESEKDGHELCHALRLALGKDLEIARAERNAAYVKGKKEAIAIIKSQGTAP